MYVISYFWIIILKLFIYYFTNDKYQNDENKNVV